MLPKLLTALLALLFLGVMFGGLFNISMGMTMTGDVSNCPFMGHGEVVCSMSVFDHFDAWESTFTMVVPTIMILLLALVTVVTILTRAPNLVLVQRFLDNHIYTRKRVVSEYAHAVRPLQELFSQGILNPKLF